MCVWWAVVLGFFGYTLNVPPRLGLLHPKKSNYFDVCTTGIEAPCLPVDCCSSAVRPSRLEGRSVVGWYYTSERTFQCSCSPAHASPAPRFDERFMLLPCQLGAQLNTSTTISTKLACIHTMGMLTQSSYFRRTGARSFNGRHQTTETHYIQVAVLFCAVVGTSHSSSF